MNAVKVIISQKWCKLVIGSLVAYETPPFSVTSFLLVSCKHFQMQFLCSYAAIQFNIVIYDVHMVSQRAASEAWSKPDKILTHLEHLMSLNDS